MSERRWTVVGEDGRYCFLGRHSDPTDQELVVTEEAMREAGLAGYLAIMEGNPFVDCLPRLLEVRPMAGPTRPFAEVAETCVAGIEARRKALPA